MRSNRPSKYGLSLFAILHSPLTNTDATRCAKDRGQTAKPPDDPAHRAAPACDARTLTRARTRWLDGNSRTGEALVRQFVLS